jgi:hypothetical protein
MTGASKGHVFQRGHHFRLGLPLAILRELVREGVENDWPYIFTDLEFEPMIEARFAAIKQGFDNIRGRNPKR